MKSIKWVGIIATALICSSVTLYAAEGGYSGGGGDVFVKEYNEVRSYWENRFTWVVKHREWFSSQRKGGCGSHKGDIFCDKSDEVLRLLTLAQRDFRIESSPTYISLSDGSNYPAYTEKFNKNSYRTRFNFQYWQALPTEKRRELVLHEHLVAAEMEETNQMDITDEVMDTLPEMISETIANTENADHDLILLEGGTLTETNREYIEDDFIKNKLVRIWCINSKPEKIEPGQQRQQQEQQQQQAIAKEEITLKPGASAIVNLTEFKCKNPEVVQNSPQQRQQSQRQPGER